jgi:hypothetical protein
VQRQAKGESRNSKNANTNHENTKDEKMKEKKELFALSISKASLVLANASQLRILSALERMRPPAWQGAVMEALKIIVLCIVSAMLYGISHDQVTARVCVEYFTIGHPPVFHTESPTLLAFGWGMMATWWAGLILGIPAALVCRLGSWPKYGMVCLLRAVWGLMIVTGCAALLAGIAGYFVASGGGVWLVKPLASRVPQSKHIAFLADLWAHLAAYGMGFLGGITICGWILFCRKQMARLEEKAQ